MTPAEAALISFLAWIAVIPLAIFLGWSAAAVRYIRLGHAARHVRLDEADKAYDAAKPLHEHLVQRNIGVFDAESQRLSIELLTKLHMFRQSAMDDRVSDGKQSLATYRQLLKAMDEETKVKP